MGAVQQSDRSKERHKYCIKRATESWGSVRIRLNIMRVVFLVRLSVVRVVYG